MAIYYDFVKTTNTGLCTRGGGYNRNNKNMNIMCIIMCIKYLYNVCYTLNIVIYFSLVIHKTLGQNCKFKGGGEGACRPLLYTPMDSYYLKYEKTCVL